jgi:hypothetical protein
MEKTAFLFERKLDTIFVRQAGHDRLLRAAMIAGCQAESKALLMSRKAAAHVFFSIKADSVKDVKEWAAVSVEWLSLNPCWF